MYHTDEDFANLLYNILYYPVVLGVIAILANIAIIAICMVIVAIGQCWKNIKYKARNRELQRKYENNPTEIIYYTRYH